MWRPVNALAFFSLLSCLVLMSCAGPVSEQSTVDLISSHVVARVEMETGAMRHDSPLASYYWEKGWKFDTPEIAATAPRCRIRYRVMDPTERRLQFRVYLDGSMGSVESQGIEIYNNGSLLSRLEISAERTLDASLRIPEGTQVAGDNVLEFRFDRFPVDKGEIESFIDEHNWLAPGIAAYFQDFGILPWESNKPDGEYAWEDAEALRLLGKGRGLAQRNGTVLRYVSRQSRPGTLSIAGEVRLPRGFPKNDTLEVAIRARSDADPEWRELWRWSYTRGESKARSFDAEIGVELGADSGYGEYAFEVLSPFSSPRAFVIWKEMSLVLSEPAPEPRESPAPEREDLSKEIDHVLIVILDAARADHFGCYGNSEGLTPNCDALAGESIVFVNAIAPAPHTRASVPSILMGINTERHGLEGPLLTGDHENFFDAFKRKEFVILSMSGNWVVNALNGFYEGFDKILRVSIRSRKSIARPQHVKGLEEGIEYLASCESKTLSYMHFLPPHWPYYPPKEFRKFADEEPPHWLSLKARLENGLIGADDEEVLLIQKLYKNNVLYADYIVGKLVEYLKKYGIYDRCMLIITADHGEALGDHNQVAHGHSVYEELIRVPLIVRMPGGESRRVQRVVGLIDLFPTFVEVFGLDSDTSKLDGHSLAPLLAGGEAGVPDYYFVSRGAGKLMFAMRGERLKYVNHYFREEMYDLEADPLEETNIIDKHPVLASFLRQRAMLVFLQNPGRSGDEVDLSDEDIEELKNLGYLQ